MAGRLSIGKLPPALLFSALGDTSVYGVMQGPGIGRDAAIVTLGEEALVAAADPITFVEASAARLAVTVNANDIWVVGAEPRWLLTTVLAPPGSESAEILALIEDIRRECSDAGLALVGGHTEVTDAVTRTVLSCAMFGTAPLAQIIPSTGACDGDLIVQAGAAAVEGTALLGCPELWDDPGISIAESARALRRIRGVHAMHDVTEGGIATAALELAQAAGLEPQLDADAIRWLPQTLDVCAERGLDPLGLLGSGTLLAAVSPEASEHARSALHARGLQAEIVGRVRAGSPATLNRSGQPRPFPRFDRDEALRALTDDAPADGQR